MIDRSQQRFLLASCGGHALIFAIAVLGTAFYENRKLPPEVPNIRVVPSKLIDELLAGGGGNPSLPQTDEAPAPAPPADPLPTQPPAPEIPKPELPREVEKPEPVREPLKPVPVRKPDPPPPKPQERPKPVLDAKPTIVDTKPVPRKPDIDIDPSKIITRTRPDDTEKKRKQREETARKEREDAERKALEEWNRQAQARKEGLASAFRSTKETLGTSFASDKGVKIEVAGPGGAAYANYSAFVKKAYDNAWILSPTLGDEDQTTEVSVTVLRSGEILNARITRRSGNSALDKSVESALARVKQLPPFPESTRDERRTFPIRFNLKAKRSAG